MLQAVYKQRYVVEIYLVRVEKKKKMGQASARIFIFFIFHFMIFFWGTSYDMLRLIWLIT